MKYQVYALYPADPYVILNSDSGNVASVVAGWFYPERFSNDLMLGVPGRTSAYISLFLPTVAFIHLFHSDLGQALAFLMFPIVLLQLVGFYLLGMKLTEHRLISVCLALLSLVPIQTIPGDFWGILHIPIVRSAYGALLPWLILAALRVDTGVRSLTVFLGLAVFGQYVHGVSGPTVTAACLLGMLAIKPITTGWARWIGTLVLLGLIWLLGAAPFAWVYLTSFPTSSVDPNVLSTIQEWGVYGNASLAWAHFLDTSSLGLNWRGRGVLWGCGLVGLIVGACQAGKLGLHSRFLLLFGVGIVIFSIGIASVDQAINAYFGRGPMQIDLIRNSRYIVPVLCIGLAILVHLIWTWLARAAAAKPSTASKAIPVMMALFVVLSTYRLAAPYVSTHLPGLLSWQFNDASPLVQKHIPKGSIDALASIRALKNGTRVLPIANDTLALAVRYGSKQPLVWANKDRNLLLYSSMQALSEWVQTSQTIERTQAPQGVAATKGLICQLIEQRPHDVLLLDATRVHKTFRQSLIKLDFPGIKFQDSWLIYSHAVKCTV